MTQMVKNVADLEINQIIADAKEKIISVIRREFFTKSYNQTIELRRYVRIGETDYDSIKKVAREFMGVEHRIEFVREVKGVKYYNDSIASSPTRTIAGLKAFNQKVHLIAGGYDKHIPYEPLVPYILEKVEKLYLCGATADKIEAAVKADKAYNGTPEIIRCESITAAVLKANEIAKAGDIVTLSPASASFDAYPNFVARGNHFKELVNKL